MLLTKITISLHPQLADPHNPFVVLLVKLTRMVAGSATGLCGGFKNFDMCLFKACFLVSCIF